MDAQIISLAERRQRKLIGELAVAWLEFHWRCWCAWWEYFGLDLNQIGGGPPMK